MGFVSPKTKGKAPLLKWEFFKDRGFEGKGLAPILKQGSINTVDSEPSSSAIQ